MTIKYLPPISMRSTDELPDFLESGQLIYYRDTRDWKVFDAESPGRFLADFEASISIPTATIADSAVTADKIAASAVTGAKLAAGIINVTLLAGGDGDPATYELTGAALGDEVVFVGHFSTAASIASLADVTSDFTITDTDELTDGGATDYSNDQLMVIWLDKT